MSAQVYVNLTLSLAGRASVRSGKGVSDRIDESKFRFLNGLLPHPNPPPRGREQSGEMARLVPAFCSALPVVCAESDSLMNCGKTPSPRGGGTGWGLLAYLSLARRSPQWGEGWRGGSEYPAARHGPFTYTTSARVYVNHQTAPSPVGEGRVGGSKRPVARHGPFTYTMSAQVNVNPRKPRTTQNSDVKHLQGVFS